MPVTTPEIKLEAVRRLGGHVKLIGETYSETQTYAQVQICAQGGCPTHAAVSDACSTSKQASVMSMLACMIPCGHANTT